VSLLISFASASDHGVYVYAVLLNLLIFVYDVLYRNEALGLMVGTLGVVPLSAHTIPNQVTMIVCQFPFSFGTALAIRMGHVLSRSVEHAKHIAAGTTFLSTAFFAIASIGVYYSSDWFFDVFTSDDEVIAMAQSIWWKVRRSWCFGG
jgi:Na+-driven multidrug efflux pump